MNHSNTPTSRVITLQQEIEATTARLRELTLQLDRETHRLTSTGTVNQLQVGQRVKILSKHGGLFGETGEVVKVHRVYASILLDKNKKKVQRKKNKAKYH